ncbi:hypothetical protein RTBOTA2_005004 [Rhodotorula toruloides]|nr:hypothetical protein RTBOTA2_005004 [Rhodotorula toruloides]PRQ74476.1 hypothetical protein AAT19DRAFT_14829 [Rhodotorula toruloides]
MMQGSNASSTPAKQAEPEPRQDFVYPERYLAVMCMLLDVKSAAWYNEFEEIYAKHPGIERIAEEFVDRLGAMAYKPSVASDALRHGTSAHMRYLNYAVPALLRRRYIHLHHDKPIQSSEDYEKIRLTPESLDEAQPLRLDSGSTIDVQVYLERFDVFDKACRNWGWLGALGVNTYYSVQDLFRPSQFRPAPSSGGLESHEPLQSVSRLPQPATASHVLRQRHVFTTS